MEIDLTSSSDSPARGPLSQSFHGPLTSVATKPPLQGDPGHVDVWEVGRKFAKIVEEHGHARSFGKCCFPVSLEEFFQ